MCVWLCTTMFQVSCSIATKKLQTLVYFQVLCATFEIECSMRCSRKDVVWKCFPNTAKDCAVSHLQQAAVDTAVMRRLPYTWSYLGCLERATLSRYLIGLFPATVAAQGSSLRTQLQTCSKNLKSCWGNVTRLHSVEVIFVFILCWHSYSPEDRTVWPPCGRNW